MKRIMVNITSARYFPSRCNLEPGGGLEPSRIVLRAQHHAQRVQDAEARRLQRVQQQMTYIAYTDCANGFRYFTALSNVGASFDPKLIARLVDEHKQAAVEIEARREQTENHPFVKLIGGLTDSDKQHNQKVVDDQRSLAKRITTAEAAIDGHLVRGSWCSPHGRKPPTTPRGRRRFRRRRTSRDFHCLFRLLHRGAHYSAFRWAMPKLSGNISNL